MAEMKPHLAITVSDVDRSTPFYRALLDAEPAKQRPGYVKFEPDDPGIVLALIEGERGDGLGAFNHGGIKVSSTDEVLATRLRLKQAGLATFDEMDTECCYARQDKIWVTDPDGTPWEVFTVLEDVEHDAPAATALLRVMSVEVAQPGLRTPQQLYEDWERAHWAAQDVDLNRDPADWAALAEGERNLLYWVLSSLMVAEERISTQFCGLVLAQDDEEEGSYLSTQLVDEVRHMQFYARFQNEVIADPAAIGAHVARAREVLGDSVPEGLRRGAGRRARPAARRPAQPRGEGRLRDRSTT